jgi:peptidoglycan/xylan/chitin deacetylase (PgdA/CDA1 family)
MKDELNICLNYHDFSGTKVKTRDVSKYTIDFSFFKDQLSVIEEFNNKPLGYLASDECKGDISCCLTFDDGYKSNLYIAEELYKKSLTGTFFIITNTLRMNRDYLSVSDIREIHQMGMEIGSHSCTHRHLSRLNTDEMMKELTESKAILEDILGFEVKSVAFPGGHFGSREIKYATQAGYLLKRTCHAELNHKPLYNGIVNSFTVTDEIDLHTFRKILELNFFSLGKIKLREMSLFIPKYIYFRFINTKQSTIL